MPPAHTCLDYDKSRRHESHSWLPFLQPESIIKDHSQQITTDSATIWLNKFDLSFKRRFKLVLIIPRPVGLLHFKPFLN
jgi:hypothetical protein